MVDKPPMGSPCNHCGLCCKTDLCVIGRQVYGEFVKAPCPALRMSQGGASSCGLVADPAAYVHHKGGARHAERLATAAKLVIGAGVGCDTQADGEPMNVAFDNALTANFRANKARMMKAASVWGLGLVSRSRDHF
jgi:hypothetical protein